MRASVAKLLVPVALFAAAAPALASTSTQLDRAEASKTALASSADQNIRNGYWMASSEYYVTPKGMTATGASGRPLRRVLITGYHPTEGFETEIAKEQAEAARH